MQAYVNLAYQPFEAPEGTVVDRIRLTFNKLGGPVFDVDLPPSTAKSPAVTLTAGDYTITAQAVDANTAPIGPAVTITYTATAPSVQIAIPASLIVTTD